MARHPYRVVRRLPWIEGGRPSIGYQWEGGRTVVYEPGDTLSIDDREIDGVYCYLEATDDAGSMVLEAARVKAEAPARRIAVADLHPRAVEWLTRALDEKLRRDGHLRELCIRIIARDDDPTREDLAAALEESPEPPPPELLEYVAKILAGTWRKSGRKAPPRTTDEDLLIQRIYHLMVDDFTRYKHRFPLEHKRPHLAAAKLVADHFQLSVRTIQRIVAPRPWTKTDKT